MPHNYDVLKLNTEFRRVYGRGKSFVHPLLVTYVLKRKGNLLRMGITSGKKVGCAVKRNRSRRVIRAAFSQICGRLPQGYDIVFVARSRTVAAKSYEVAKVMEAHLREAGVLK